jgi:6-pyruvoyl-tetrahydropterin synthase related domain
MKRYLWLALLTVMTLPAVWPFTTVVFFGSDDGLLHLFRLHGLDDAIHQGILYPRLFPTFAFGYGHAVLSYYGPLSYYVAELARVLGAGYVDAFKWAYAFGFVGSAFAAYALARRFVAPAAALFGAAVYLYFPYHLVLTFQRGALAEHMTWIFTPLILWGITPQFDLAGRSGAPVKLGSAALLVAALSIAALIVTHSLVAMMFMPFVVVYGWLVNHELPLGQRVTRLALALFAGLGLSAFYWLPVATQGRWVQLSATAEGEGFVRWLAPTFNFIQTTLIFDYVRGIGYPDHPLGGVDTLLLLAALGAAVYGWRRRERWWLPLSLFLFLSVVSLFLVVDAALPVWHVLAPVLGFLQFPWRFMTVAGLGIAMASVFLFRNRIVLPCLLLPVLIVTSLAGLHISARPETGSDVQSMLKREFQTKHIGSTYTEEYLPWWVTADPLAIPRAADTPKTAAMLSSTQLQLLDAGYTYRRYAVNSNSVLTLRLHQFYFPPWRATLNGQSLPTYPTTELGLLTVDVPPTSGGILEVDYGATVLEQLGIVLSLASAGIVVFLGRGRWLFAAAAVAVLLGLIWGVGRLQATPSVQPIQVTVGDVAELIGIQIEPKAYRPGDSLQLTLSWLALRETGENLQAFVHVIDAASGRLIAQSDGIPVWGYTPTSQWRVGELIEDTRTLAIPQNALPGAYMVVAGLYRLQPQQNLPATQMEKALPDGQISLGIIQVIGQ